MKKNMQKINVQPWIQGYKDTRIQGSGRSENALDSLRKAPSAPTPGQ